MLAKAVSHSLDAALITDDIGVNPIFDDDFLLVAPDGSTAVVQVDLDILGGDQPTVVLIPDSRAVYEALVHRRLAATG